jgi:hypothetical protein
MKKIMSLLVAMFSLGMNMVAVEPADAAKSYTIALTLIVEEAATNFALYDDEGNQDSAHGRKKCSDDNPIWLNPNPTSTSDIAKSMKVNKNTRVKVKSDSGRTVGIGTLSKVGWIKDREEQDEDEEIGYIIYGTCTYSQSIKVSKSAFYSIELSGTKTPVNPFDISFQDLMKKKWKLTLTV